LLVDDISQLIPVRETLSESYQGEILASSVVQVATLFDPRVKVEIEAIAAVNQ